MAFFIEQIAIGPMANFAYVIGDDASGLAAVVDPGWEAQRLHEAVQAHGCSLEMILLTHTHFDHVNSLPELCRLAEPKHIYVHELEAAAVPETQVPLLTTAEGSTITLGSVQLQCLHTPGHSPGGQCFVHEAHCITGDTLFVDGCGRVDLPGSDPEAMYHSLQRLAALPAETQVYCGHDYGSASTSTIGKQLQNNPYLRAQSREEFLGHRL